MMVPLTKLPTLVRLEAVTEELRVFPVSVPAAAVMVMLPDPSKEVPLMVLGVCKVVAVVAFPERAPEKVVVAKTLVEGLKVIPVPRDTA